MAHKKIIDSVKKQGQVAIKDLDEFLRFIINESDMRTYDDNYISILIPMKFDIDKVFGLDVCKRSDDDYVILYSCWYPTRMFSADNLKCGCTTTTTLTTMTTSDSILL